MKRNEPTGVGDILSHLIRTTALGEQLRQAEVWKRWPEIAGRHLAPHGRPLTLRDGTLVIEVRSAVWMHRYTYHKWTIIRRINAFSRRELVSDVFIQLAKDEDPLPPQDEA